MKQGLSRAEANKEIRRIFVKNGVDTSKIQYSSSGRTLTLSGKLVKDGGQDVSANQVENIVKDVFKLGITIYCELENWTISEGSVSKKAASSSESENKSNEKPGQPKSGNQNNKSNVQAQTGQKTAA